MLSEVKNKILYWLVPPGVTDIYRNLRTINLKSRALCRSNSRFKGIHQGKRCFILCNGPSVSKQNLLLLKNEIIFSVSSGYHHKDYLTVQPKYHAVPRMVYNKSRRPEDVVSWFKEMHSKVGTAELFLDAADEPLIKKNGLFPGRRINYVYTGFSQDERQKEVIDIARKIPGITTSPILCMIIAIYMGFKEIYLLGVDNDYWKTGEYKHFFEPTVLKGTDIEVHENGKLKLTLFQQFLGFGTLLRQYWIIHNIARNNGFSIFNATEGGALEEFPRVKFESLFSK